MRRSRDLSSSSSNSQEDANAQHSTANGNEERTLSPTRRLTGSRRSMQISGDVDYDSINQPLAKSPRPKKGSSVSIYQCYFDILTAQITTEGCFREKINQS